MLSHPGRNISSCILGLQADYADLAEEPIYTGLAWYA